MIGMFCLHVDAWLVHLETKKTHWKHLETPRWKKSHLNISYYFTFVHHLEEALGRKVYFWFRSAGGVNKLNLWIPYWILFVIHGWKIHHEIKPCVSSINSPGMSRWQDDDFSHFSQFGFWHRPFGGNATDSSNRQNLWMWMAMDWKTSWQRDVSDWTDWCCAKHVHLRWLDWVMLATCVDMKVDLTELHLAELY